MPPKVAQQGLLKQKYQENEKIVQDEDGNSIIEGFIDDERYTRTSHTSAKFYNTYYEGGYWAVRCWESDIPNGCIIEHSFLKDKAGFKFEFSGDDFSKATKVTLDFNNPDIDKEWTIMASGEPVTSTGPIEGSKADYIDYNLTGAQVMSIAWVYKGEFIFSVYYVKDLSYIHAKKFVQWAHKIQNKKPPKQAPKAVELNDNLNHIHGERSHSHALPAQGKAHKHGNGPLGR